MVPTKLNPTSIRPQTKPLYWKPAGKAPRKIGIVPTSLKSDIDRLRALAQAPFQLQALTEDAYAQSLLNNVLNTLGSSGNAVNNGNAEVAPVIYFNVASGDITTPNLVFSFYNTLWMSYYSDISNVNSAVAATGGIQIDVTTLPAPGPHKLDLKNRILWRLDVAGPVDVSSSITTRHWWTVLPDSLTNQLRFDGITSGVVVAWPDGWA